MGRTSESEKIRKEFLENLKVLVKGNGYELIGPLAPKEIYFITKKNHTLLFVFIKVSVPREKFWGLNEKSLSDFKKIINENKTRGWVHERIVILLEGPQRGYLLKGDVFDELMSSLYIDRNGDYKILEKDLDRLGTKGRWFLDLEDLLKGIGLYEEATS